MSLSKATVWAVLAALLAVPRPADAAVARGAFDGLFGSVAFRDQAPPEWLYAIARLRADQRLFDACVADPAECRSPAALRWIAELERIGGLAPRARIEAVNRAVNRWSYRADSANFRRPDYWAAPSEFLARSGDCEDYVIFKMFSLRRVGFTDDQLRIVLVRDTKNNADHAVLAVALGGEILILDNNSERVLPHHRFANYIPLQSFGRHGSWGHVRRQRHFWTEGGGPVRPATGPAAR